MKQIIPIFFSCDNNYIPYLSVTIQSLIDHAASDIEYRIYVLHTDINEESQKKLLTQERENIKISFVSVLDKIKNISNKLDDVRDYYTQTIFYRLFIAELFPNYSKAIYLDCDIIILDDLKDFFNINLNNNIVACVVDKIVAHNDDFKVYVKEFLGVDNEHYFNSGVLLINLDEYRKEQVEDAFYQMVTNYSFKSVAPDQDFLNYVLKNRHLEISEDYNRMPIADDYNGKMKIIHFNMFMKPWLYDNVIYEDYFWKYAKETIFYSDIKEVKNNYSDKNKASDLEGVKRMERECYEIIHSNHTYVKLFTKFQK